MGPDLRREESTVGKSVYLPLKVVDGEYPLSSCYQPSTLQSTLNLAMNTKPCYQHQTLLSTLNLAINTKPCYQHQTLLSTLNHATTLNLAINTKPCYQHSTLLSTQPCYQHSTMLSTINLATNTQPCYQHSNLLSTLNLAPLVNLVVIFSTKLIEENFCLLFFKFLFPSIV